MPIHKIEDLLNEGHSRFTPLQRLLRTSSNQKQWTAELRALIDPPLRTEVQVTQVKGTSADILCQSAAAATRLRFMMPDLTPQLRNLSSFSRVRNFNIRVSHSTG